ncbi:uncharacterized protein METZ01_LOCUS387495, partial [marine metagenome]
VAVLVGTIIPARQGAPSSAIQTLGWDDYTTVNLFPLVEAAGSAYDMGYAHGAQAAGLI